MGSGVAAVSLSPLPSHSGRLIALALLHQIPLPLPLSPALTRFLTSSHVASPDDASEGGAAPVSASGGSSASSGGLADVVVTESAGDAEAMKEADERGAPPAATAARGGSSVDATAAVGGGGGGGVGASGGGGGRVHRSGRSTGGTREPDTESMAWEAAAEGSAQVSTEAPREAPPGPANDSGGWRFDGELGRARSITCYP